MKSYEQRMETSGVADRIALVAHEHLVRMYERMGFVDKGRSPVTFGGGGWTSLVSLSHGFFYGEGLMLIVSCHRYTTLRNMVPGWLLEVDFYPIDETADRAGIWMFMGPRLDGASWLRWFQGSGRDSIIYIDESQCCG